jgi:murein DD-endopeptidase MepM/ murein hydrolase activator NlpD
MSNPQFHHFLLRLRRSALFRSRPLLLASSTALLVVLFFSVSFVLSITSRQASTEGRSASTIQSLFRSIGLAGNDELGLNGESDKVTLDEGENDLSHRVEKRVVKKGESIYTILTASGLTPNEVHQLTSQLKEDKSFKGLTAGKTYLLETGRSGKFIRFTWQSSPYAMLHLVKDERTGQLSTQKETIEYETRVATLEGTLHSSLSSELRNRNRSSLSPQLGKILASRLDFKKDIHAGATYRILFQEQWNGKQFIGTGDILAIEINSKGEKFNAYQFSDAKGDSAYYDEKGRAMAQGRTLFIEPCRFNRVSSGFGYRVHPISGRSEFHGGVDLVAPTGTPVKAAADGRVIFRGLENGTGNMVTISHAGGLHTMYLHLSRFTPTCRYGKAVKQGEVIGYVGSTGRSTGSHLDFRIIRNGHPENPLVALKQTAPRQSLSSRELRSFMARVHAYQERLGGTRPVMVADAGGVADPLL